MKKDKNEKGRKRTKKDNKDEKGRKRTKKNEHGIINYTYRKN